MSPKTVETCYVWHCQRPREGYRFCLPCLKWWLRVPIEQRRPS